MQAEHQKVIVTSSPKGRYFKLLVETKPCLALDGQQLGAFLVAGPEDSR